MSRRGNPTKQIELRQRGEDHTKEYQFVCAAHEKLKLSANWENKTHRRIETNHFARAMDVAQARFDDVLVARRQRLAELLQNERSQHEHMLENMAVTDDQRRERLMQQARDLRAHRERLRKEDAEQRKDRLFREQSALVREAESHIKVLHVANERQQQIEAAARRLEAEKEEDRFWEEQQREEIRKQAARAQQDLHKLHTRAQQTRCDLDVQVKHNIERKSQFKHQEVVEDQVYCETIKAGIKADQEAEAARRAKQRSIAEETKIRNTEIRRLKDLEDAKMRENEKSELDELLQKIADDERREAERKKAAREEAVYQMKFVEAQMNAAAESETALDRQWQEENDRQWAKRESQWRQEQAKREATMVDVFRTRKQQVVEIRSQENTDTDAKRREHDELVEKANEMLRQDAALKQKQRATNIETRKFLSSQIAEKQAGVDSEKNARKTELSTSQAVEYQYQEKIGRELRKLEEAKPTAYSHVKLNSTKKPLGY